jgi:hypothetical protein
MAATATGHGYWLTTAKGDVYSFGDAIAFGSESGRALPAPVVAITPLPGGGGYWLSTSKGNVYNFGAAAWYGSKASSALPAAIVAGTAG